MSRSRAVVSLPCNCRISGCNVSTMLASVASSASTVSATFTARPLACLPRSRAVFEAEMPRRGGKNTNPTMSAPACSAASSVSRVDRPQILTSQGHGFRARIKMRPAATTAGQATGGAVLQRRALLVSPDGPVTAALRSEPEGAADRLAGPPCWRADRPVAPEPAGHRLRAAAPPAASAAAANQVAEPPATTPAIATTMMMTNSGNVIAIDGLLELNGSNDTVTR